MIRVLELSAIHTRPLGVVEMLPSPLAVPLFSEKHLPRQDRSVPESHTIRPIGHGPAPAKMVHCHIRHKPSRPLHKLKSLHARWIIQDDCSFVHGRKEYRMQRLSPELIPRSDVGHPGHTDSVFCLLLSCGTWTAYTSRHAVDSLASSSAATLVGCPFDLERSSRKDDAEINPETCTTGGR